MKVEKKSELIGRGGVYRRPVVDMGANCTWRLRHWSVRIRDLIHPVQS